MFEVMWRLLGLNGVERTIEIGPQAVWRRSKVAWAWHAASSRSNRTRSRGGEILSCRRRFSQSAVSALKLMEARAWLAKPHHQHCKRSTQVSSFSGTSFNYCDARLRLEFHDFGNS